MEEGDQDSENKKNLPPDLPPNYNDADRFSQLEVSVLGLSFLMLWKIDIERRRAGLNYPLKHASQFNDVGQCLTNDGIV